MNKKKPFWRKITWSIFFIFLFLLAGQIVLIAVQSRTPPFKTAVNEISELIPNDSSKVILLSNLEKESSHILNHSLIKQFKELKMTAEIITSKKGLPFVKGLKAFEKYSGLKLDQDMFFRFFGKEAAICKIKNDFLVIASVDRLTLFLKQVTKTLSKYKILKKDIITKSYNRINIEELSVGKQKLYFTFIGKYAFCSNNESRIQKIIQRANEVNGENLVKSIKSKRFQNILSQSRKKYPIVIYEKKPVTKELSKTKGIDRLEHLFAEQFWGITFQNKQIKVDYHYFYTNQATKDSLSKIVHSKKAKSNLLKHFPKATAVYLTSAQFNSEKLYKWFLTSWLVTDKEKDTLNKTFSEVEQHFRVAIRRFISQEFKNEIAFLLTGIGYQGYNPFPKMALIVKVGKYAKAIDKMKKIFRYSFDNHALKKTRLHGVSVYYLESKARFGHSRYWNRSSRSYKPRGTSDHKDFSPSFAYINGYLIVTFNKNSMNAILYYFKGGSGKGIAKNSDHQSFWKGVSQKYSFQYYVNPERFKDIAQTYLDNLSENEPNEFIYSDAKNRLTPLINLLDDVRGIGGGFNLLKDRVKGELVFRLK